MRKISEERLDQMLTNLCESEPEQPFIYRQPEPETAPIPFYTRYKGLAAAAVLVFVSALSLTVYFFWGNKAASPIPVLPAPFGTAPSVSATAGDGEPQTGESRVQTSSESPAQAPSDSPTSRRDATAPSVPSSRRATVSPTEATKPTERQEPTEKASPTAEPPSPPPPTIPIAPPWVDDPTEPSGWHDPPTEGDEPGLDTPTEGGIMTPASVEFYGSFGSGRLPADRRVYCKLYDSSGRLVGDSYVYSAGHLAEIVSEGGGIVYVLYTAPDGWIQSAGYYNFVFYDSNGTLLTQGQEYVDY